MFSKYYTSEEVVELFAPSETTVKTIANWLREAGVQDYSVSANQQWIQFDTDVNSLEALLITTYHLFEHIATGVSSIACDE